MAARKPRRPRGKASSSRSAPRLLFIALGLAAAFAAGVWFSRKPSVESAASLAVEPAAATASSERTVRGAEDVANASHGEPYSDLADPDGPPVGEVEQVSPGTAASPSPQVGVAGAATAASPNAPVGVLALVIDDLGRSLADLDTLAALGIPLSYAVLPYESMTPQVVATLRKRQVELLLHLPMEASSGADPGPGALRSSMTPAELRAATLRAVAAVPGATGVNNHMGSELSADSRAMTAVLQVLVEKDLFFLDSRTSAASVGYRVARELGVPAAERQVFLDAEPPIDAVRAEVARWLALARDKGAAIAIGHPHPGTLTVLAEEVPKAKAAGFEFVPVSYLLEAEGGPE